MKNNRIICLEDINSEWIKNNIVANENIFYLLFKRLADIFFGCIGFVFFILILPIVYVLIKLEAGGPVFYIRKRVGLNGKIFDFYKFSSMVGNDNKDNDKDLWRVKDENQITKIGKILRKTHFDELPQSINLLKGDLSFVGPRPEWIEIAKIFEQEIPFYKQRYLVKPGLFGWAQINYKASSSIDEAKKKFEYDLYYIKNQSILLDLEIILKSINLFFQ